MKTAVSVPDELFRRAESTARRLRVSRSELYASAIRDFLARHDAKAITKRLNEIYDAHPAKLDPVLQQAQMGSLEKEDW